MNRFFDVTGALTLITLVFASLRDGAVLVFSSDRSFLQRIEKIGAVIVEMAASTAAKAMLGEGKGRTFKLSAIFPKG